MRIIGNVPKNVVYYSSVETQVWTRWDDDEDDDDTTVEKTVVLPAYCSDANNKKTRETGYEWADRSIRYLNNGAKTKSTVKVTETEVPNEPINGVRIVSLEVRSEGGRAYKVVTKDNFYVDLREDVLLDIMKNESISKGVIECDLLWCKIGSEMKLVRVDSELHRAAIESGKLKETKVIGKPEVGFFYGMRNGDSLLFLGNVTGQKIDYDSKSTPFTGQLWLEIPDYRLNKLNGDFIDAAAMYKDMMSGYGSSPRDSMLGYYLKFVKKAAVVQQLKYKTDITFDSVKSEINLNAAQHYKNVINGVNLVP